MEAVPQNIQEARDKLKAKFGNGAHAGKGVGRRSKKVVHQSNNVEDGKLKLTLRKLGCQPIDMISEVNFFPKSEDIYHFSKCQVWISPMNNTTAVFGTPERAPLKNYFPGIINQLGLASLLNAAQLAKGEEAQKAAEDEDVPDLVENFEEVSKEN